MVRKSDGSHVPVLYAILSEDGEAHDLLFVAEMLAPNAVDNYVVPDGAAIVGRE